MLNYSIKKQPSVFALLLVFSISIITSPLKAALDVQLSDGNSLNLIGIGMHQELRNDIYLGALFSPSSISNADDLLDTSIAKRMSLRFVANYSSRKMARHWKERLAMNNPRAEWQPFTKEIIGFSKIFKTGFKPGDEINIDYIPGAGTEVYLNSTLFKIIDEPSFMNLLLNVWLGTNPPTKAFKKDIRGKGENKSGFSSDYASLQPVLGRFDGDLGKKPVRVAQAETKPKQEEIQPEQQKVIALEDKPIETNKSDNNSELAAIAPAVAEATKQVANTLNDVKGVASSVSSTGNNIQVAAVEETTNNIANAAESIEPNQQATQSQVVEAPSEELASSATPETAPVEQVASLSKPEKVTEPEEEFFDADLLAGSYIRDLLSAVRKKQYYPDKALDRNQEGTVIAKVIVDTNGKPTHISIIEKARSVHLNRATVKIIKKASLPPIPAELKRDSFEFEVPMLFSLE